MYLPTNKVNSSCLIKSNHEFKDTAKYNLTYDVKYNVAKTIMKENWCE